MPFMRGRAPIRRTLQYLQKGQIILRDSVKIFSINYNTTGDHHHGARDAFKFFCLVSNENGKPIFTGCNRVDCYPVDFIFWYLPQVQYKNPDVQCISFKNLTPSPFVTVFFNSGEKVYVDIESRSKDDIQDHLKQFVAVCKTKEELEFEAKSKEKKDNPANFGYDCERHCICEIPGQLPCPNLVPLPDHMRGKYKYPQN